MLLNRKARFDYNILSTLEAGISLLGSEVKVLRNGLGDIVNSHVMIHEEEAWLVNMLIPTYSHASIEYDTTRNRKLLLKKRQIKMLFGKLKEKGMSVIPLKLYFVRGLVKIELGVGEGKKKYDKRRSIKEKDLRRDIKKGIV